MSYSQVPLLEQFARGRVPGEHTEPRHIETVISNVYLFPSNVYKIYKNNNEFFNSVFRDIRTADARFEFTRRDFAWNHALSPDIYTHTTWASSDKDGAVFREDPEGADELVIVMNRVDTSHVLYELLCAGTFSVEDATTVGTQIGNMLQRVQTPVTDNYYENSVTRLHDLRAWLMLQKHHVPASEIARYCDYLESYLTEHRTQFEGVLSEEMTLCGDLHSHNAVYIDETIRLMDTFAPKEEWGIGHPHIKLYRLGTDIYALTGSEKVFNAYIEGYASTRTHLSREHEHYYVVYAAGIMLSYLYMLSNNDARHMVAATTYHAFLRTYFAQHCA